jgi:hypothetical protein
MSFNYDLPYRTQSIYKVTNTKLYIIMYLAQLPLLFIIIFTQTSMDCVTLTIISHLCGQLGVLSIRINNLNMVNQIEEFRKIIKRHQELIKYIFIILFFYYCFGIFNKKLYFLLITDTLFRIGLNFRTIYRLCLFTHFLGASIGICILVYQVLLVCLLTRAHQYKAHYFFNQYKSFF